MKTQVFKAKDIRTAQNMVADEFGEEAIIVSTKKNNGLVEIEASNSNSVITSFPRNRENNKTFSKIFLKKLDEDTHQVQKKEKRIETLNGANKFTLDFEKSFKEQMNSLQNEIIKIKKEIKGMILTDESGISERLSNSTAIKLRQANFSPKLISALNYSFQGRNLEEGKISFFRELSKKLSSFDFNRILNSENIFIFGNSGSGKSTLAAKISAFITDRKKDHKINFINVSNSATNHSETLRAYSRVLGSNLIDISNFNFKDQPDLKQRVNIFDFSGDINLSLKKIKEIKETYKDFDFCSILALQSGSNSAMINNIWSKVSEIKPFIALTKLDECWTGAEELSALALNNARIGIVTGTKIIIDSILEANEHSLTKYMKENFQSV